MDGSISLRDRRNAANGNTKIYLQGLLDQGAQLFREGEYKAALGFLTQAIEQDSDAPAAVIDKRAATYIKLQDLDSALVDAGRIVRKDKENAIGYLRVGQILQLQKLPEKALKVYGRGLRSVLPTDPHFTTLQASQNQLNLRLSPPQAADPLKLLPRELAVILFRYLNFRDIINISRVSRGWRNAVTTIPTLWQDLDFSGSQRQVSYKTLKTLVKRSQGLVKSFSTCRSSVDHKPQLLYVGDRCKSLQDLHYCGPYAGESLVAGVRLMSNLRKVVVAPQSQIIFGNCVEILHGCRQLEVAEFYSILGGSNNHESRLPPMPHLQTLVMISNHNSPSNGWNQQAGSRGLYWGTFNIMPNLRRLTLRNWQLRKRDAASTSGFPGLSYLEKLDLTSSRLEGFPELPSSLQELTIESTTFDSTALPGTLDLPNLLRISMCQVQIKIDHWLFLHKFIATNHGNFLELNVSHTLLQPDEMLELVRDTMLDSVEKLALRQCSVSDELAKYIGKHCKHLKWLDVAHTAITGVGVKDLVTQLRPSLTYLGLDSCKSVGLDAVDWARKQGLTVSFKFPENNFKGKKIRH